MYKKPSSSFSSTNFKPDSMDSVGAVSDFVTLSTSEVATERTSTEVLIGYPIYSKKYNQRRNNNYSDRVTEQDEFSTPKKLITRNDVVYLNNSDLSSCSEKTALRSNFETPKRRIRQTYPVSSIQPVSKTRKPEIVRGSARLDFDMERAIAAIPSIAEEDTVESYFEPM